MKLNKKRASRRWRVKLGSSLSKRQNYTKSFFELLQALSLLPVWRGQDHEAR